MSVKSTGSQVWETMTSDSMQCYLSMSLFSENALTPFLSHREYWTLQGLTLELWVSYVTLLLFLSEVAIVCSNFFSIL